MTHPTGGLITWFLLNTRVTPNQVSVAAFAVNLIGAVVVATAAAPAPLPVVVVVFLTWQLGASLDCTDGYLARARGVASSFGAWFDQILDFLSHTVIGGSLVLYAVKATSIDAVGAVLLTTLVLGATLLSVFAPAERNALMGTKPALDPSTHPWLTRLKVALNLTDYAAILAICSIELAFPFLLAPTLVVASLILAGSVATQVALNWFAASRS